MAERLNFTKANLLGVALPESGRSYFNDTRLNGLQLQVTAKGAKTFYVYRKINGTPKRIKLGRFPDMTVEQARRRGQAVLGEIAEGKDPADQKKISKARSITLQDVFDDYRKARKNLKPKTLYDYERVLSAALSDWRDKRLTAITKEMVAKRHRTLGEHSGEAYANLTMRVLRALFNFAASQYEDSEGQSLFPDNPVKRLSQTRSWYKDRRRSSYIPRHQLSAWFRAVKALRTGNGEGNAETTADYLTLLLFTGLRRQEAAQLRWNQVDLDARTLKITDTKNHEEHHLPLSDYLHALLSNKRRDNCDGEYVFPGEGTKGYLVEPRRQIAKVTDVSGVEFTLHDLRRTFITVAESLDIPAYALKRLVNHKMNGDVTAGYIVTDVERLRGPMQKITDFLLKAAGEISTAQVVGLGKTSGTRI